MDIADRQTEAPESHGACFVPSRNRNLYSNGTYIQAKTHYGLPPADEIFYHVWIFVGESHSPQWGSENVNSHSSVASTP